MTGGLLKTTSGLAIAAAAGIFALGTTPVLAADYGGDCCADLEERVAELEATTARHSNRNISLTIYGWVNQAILFWNDGGESDAYIVGNDNAGTRLGVKGEGKVTSDVSVGYKLELAFLNDPIGDGAGIDQGTFHGGDDSGFVSRVRQEYVYISSASLGKLTLGQQGSPLYDTNGGVDLGGGTTWSAYDYPQGHAYYFHIRRGDGTLTGTHWAGLLSSFGPSRDELIRYDTPDFAGFHLAAAWGEDDVWSLGAWYNGEFAGTQVALGVANRAVTEDDAGGTDTQVISIAGSIYNAPSGLFGTVEYDIAQTDAVGVNDATNIYAKLGWRKNVNGLGETALYGEWDQTENNGRDAQMWGLGVTQDLDAVGATMYLHYRHHEVTAGEAVICGATGCEALDTVLGGMVVTF